MLRASFRRLPATLSRARWLRLVVLGGLFAWPGRTFAQDTLRYQVRPRPAPTGTRIEITLGMHGVRRDTVVGLPVGCYGTPSIDRYVSRFEGLDGTVVRAGADAMHRVVIPNHAGETRLRYVLSYDPSTMDRYAFAPNVGPTHFHMAGCQWLLRIGDANRPHHYEIRIVDLPAGWHAYSSLGLDPIRGLQAEGKIDDLASAMIGAGAGVHRTYEIESRPVSVHIEGRFEIPAGEIADAVRTIIAGERAAMGDRSQPFYTVAVLPRSGVIAGTAVPNLFVVFIEHDIAREELYDLVAHEMFHRWLPNQIEIALPPGENAIRDEWFTEGVTEYLARWLLVRDSLLTFDQFAALANRDLYNLADNPGAADTYDALLSAAEEGRFQTAYKKLAYYRGAVMALNWEAHLKELGEGRTVLDLVVDLWHKALAQDEQVTEDQLFSLGREYGLDMRGDFERYILRAEPLIPRRAALGPDFRLVATYVPSFDPGFSIRESFRTGHVSEVRADGPAFRAGLRDGMVFRGVRNSNRFGNAWHSDLPLRVLTGADPEGRTVEYFPHGNPIAVMQYRRK